MAECRMGVKGNKSETPPLTDASIRNEYGLQGEAMLVTGYWIISPIIYFIDLH